MGGRSAGKFGVGDVDIGRSFWSIGKYEGRFGRIELWALEMVGCLRNR